MNRERLKARLKIDEGRRDTMYLCSAGVPTVGYGHNLQVPLREPVIDMMLEFDMDDAERMAYQWPWYDGLSDVRQEAIVNMVFNIGFDGVCKFKKMITAICKNDYVEAGNQIIDSKYYVQTGDRAKRVVHMMVNDEAVV